MTDLELERLRMSQELHRMSLRWISAASLSLALVLLAWPVQAAAQAPSPQQTVQAADAPAPGDSAPPITVQIAPPPISISSAMLGISSPLGAQSAAGKPIYAEFVTEHHQSFTDGNRISPLHLLQHLSRCRGPHPPRVPALRAGSAGRHLRHHLHHHRGPPARLRLRP